VTGSDFAGLRTTFNEAAELYDRVRPGYPAALFDDLAGLAPLGPGHRILEIGCGTGQATVPLARYGGRVVAVELGAEMASVARRNLDGQPAVEVVVAPFEDWPLPAEPFDVVFSATAFHWIDPSVRVAKAAAALRPGGVLATVNTIHAAGGTEAFFVDVQDCYERHDPTAEPGLRLPAADDVGRDDRELVESGRFAPAVFHHYQWEREYSTVEYRDLLLTYSGHRALPAPARAALLACITDLIDTRYGGRVAKRYLNELRTARRT
jgi:SAM-dependent methyltransferase